MNARPDTLFLNKLVSSLLTIGISSFIIWLSWIASPSSIMDIFLRSVPIIIITGMSIIITITNANQNARFIISLVSISFSLLFIFLLDIAFWGFIYIIFGSIVLLDCIITFQGCKSPIEINVNDNFMTIVFISMVSIMIGALIECTNMIIHLWTVPDMSSFYPMIKIYGIDVLLLMLWSLIGMLLFEGLLSAFFIAKKMQNGNAFTCEM